jgi:hypothetical protein
MSDSDTVTIRLGEEEAVLTPSLAAAQAVNRRFGGFTAAYERVARADFDDIAFIVAQGVGRVGPVGLRETAEKVYAAGIVTLAGPVSQYLSLLLNGGRPGDGRGAQD